MNERSSFARALVISARHPLTSIGSIEPPQSCVGNVVRIRGENFGFTQDASQVFFGDVEATEVRGWSQTAIDVVVPAGSGTLQASAEVR